MKLRQIDQTTWTRIVLGILAFSGLFVLGMVFHAGPEPLWSDWRSGLGLVLLFVVLGAYYGTIAMLDRDSEFADKDRPVIRTGLCGVLAAIAVLIIQSWPPQSFDTRWVILSFFIGAGLGWLGWTWARYVDF